MTGRLEPIVGLLARNPVVTRAIKRRRRIARLISTSTNHPTGANTSDHVNRYRELTIGLRHFLSSSTPFDTCRHRRYYAATATAVAPSPTAPPSQFTSAERDEIFFDVISTRPSSLTGYAQSLKRPQVEHAPPILTGPPAMSRQVLWDWRRWLPRIRNKGTPKIEGEMLRSRAKSGTHTYVNSIRRRKADSCIPPLTPQDPFYDEITAYRNHFGPAIDAEQHEDEAVLNERLSSWDVARLKEDGYCLAGMSAIWLQKLQFGKPTAAFQLGPGVALPLHRFENGTRVLLSRVNPLQEKPYRGAVVSTTASQLQICFTEHFIELESGEWRLDVGRPDLVFERMRAAVKGLSVDLDELHKREERDYRAVVGGVERRNWKEYILQGTALRNEILQGFAPSKKDSLEEEENDPFGGIDWEPEEAVDAVKDAGIFFEDQRIQSWARRYSLPTPLVMDGDMPLPGMNPSQIKAMAMMVGRRISLVQGPPGTGKTTMIVQTLKLLKSHFRVPQPVLVCTYTNAAVDNLVEGLAEVGLRPLRVGFEPSVRSSLERHTLHFKLEQHPQNGELKALVKEEAELGERLSQLNVRIHDLEKKMKGRKGGKPIEARLRNMRYAATSIARQQGSVKGKIYALQQEMLRDVIGDSDVICTTCITAATASLNIVDFPIVFLDEASMSTEPASLIPLMKGSRHLALIGDHKQLPPVILSEEAQTVGLGVSLFERLKKEGNTPSVMLDTQYRMHPGISLFPSTEFYRGRVRDGTVDEAGRVWAGLAPPVSAYLRTGSMVFLDHSGSEAAKDRSRVNYAEAEIIARVVADLLLSNPELRGGDIGIIAPYVAQISLLTRMFRTEEGQAALRARVGDMGALQLGQIEIKTVDGFEGREKEVILFSTVRNNGAGQVGFLGDRRRLNVGLTRARRGLVVVGSVRTLGGAGGWGRYVQHLADRGLVMRV